MTRFPARSTYAGEEKNPKKLKIGVTRINPFPGQLAVLTPLVDLDLD